MKSTSQFKPLLMARLYIHLVLALCMVLLNSLLAQSPVPDDFNPGATAPVHSFAVQADGKILLVGEFHDLVWDSITPIMRLNSDGTLDSTFNLGTDGQARSLAVQTDGKIVLGGEFTTYGGQLRSGVARLHVDGTVDDSFNPEMDGGVNSIVVQEDGKIVVGGFFSIVGGQPRESIARLHVDGTLDETFNPGVGRDGAVSCLALQADGKILVGGNFITLAGQPRVCIGRLNTDGTLDSAFEPGADASVGLLVVQADGKILVGGGFSSLGGQRRNYIGRLNMDGTLDENFDPGANGDLYVSSVALQADGKILVGGAFTRLGGQARNYVGRLNADGTLDNTFNSGANYRVYSLVLQGDGKILVGGEFTALGDEPRNYIGRLNNTDSSTQSLSQDGTTINWLRTGSSPEVWRTTFEHSTDGIAWTFIGAGTRIAGGWQLTSVSLPPDGTLRARGHVAGVFQTTSAWFVEGYYGRPVFLSQPASRTNVAGTTASFRVVPADTEHLNYQWLKNGVELVNKGNAAGANTAILTLSGVLTADEGSYSVVLSNGFGSVTSVVATLRVIEPLITEHPTGTNWYPGESVVFNVIAVGTPPLNYQWYHDGAAVPGAVGSSLTLQDLAGADAGLYTVEVSNTHGSTISSPALLTVNLATMDTTFIAEVNEAIYSLAVQADGKILVGGDFTYLGGQPRARLGRLNADGTLDISFNHGAVGGEDRYVHSLVLQADGKVLVGGRFTTLGGQSRNNIGRLNPDGTLDNTFNPGANGWAVYSLALQVDGKILVGGSFATLGGQTRNNIGRLNADGTLDSTFNPGASGLVYSLALQPDGNILVGGIFTSLGGQPRNYVGRLDADGTLDQKFDPGANSNVYSLRRR